MTTVAQCESVTVDAPRGRVSGHNRRSEARPLPDTGTSPESRPSPGTK